MSGERLGWREYLLLALFSLTVLAPGIAGIPPVDRDESRYATASTQMLESGDFVDIRFQQYPRYLQPVGIYWLQSAAVAVVSSPEAKAIWAFRLPSLLGALAASLITAAMATMLFGRRAGIAAGVLMAACFSLNFEARSAKTDAALLVSILTAQFMLMRIYLDPVGPRWRAALFWAALGAGMLIKGPIILIFAGATTAALAAWDRKAAWLKGLHVLWGLPLMLAVALPWYVAIGVVSHGDFYDAAVGKNLLGKVGASHQKHAGPIGYHLATFTLAFWPGSLMAAFAVPFAWRNRMDPKVRFLIAWIVPGWIVFELVATKLPHYVLPTYPAIAVLAAAALFAPALAAPRWAKVVGGLYAAIWLAVSAVVAALTPVLMWRLEGVVSIPLIVVGGLVFALAAATLWLTLARRGAAAIGAAAAAALIAWVTTFAGVLPRLDAFWMSPRIERAVEKAAPCPNPTLVTTPYHEPSLVFLHGHNATHLANTADEAAEALAGARACAVAVIGADKKAAFQARAETLGLDLKPAGLVEGRNYSDNDQYTLSLFTAAP